MGWTCDLVVVTVTWLGLGFYFNDSDLHIQNLDLQIEDLDSDLKNRDFTTSLYPTGKRRSDTQWYDHLLTGKVQYSNWGLKL